MSGSGSSAKMTAKGYQRLFHIERAGRRSDIAFVAMWFDEKVDALYTDAIEPAILGAGYKALRIKDMEHVNRIDDEIIAQLRRSRFMVADFTRQRGGVYFESGYMLGQGRNVFWMCAKAELEKLHFDTRQYSFIRLQELGGGQNAPSLSHSGSRRRGAEQNCRPVTREENSGQNPPTPSTSADV